MVWRGKEKTVRKSAGGFWILVSVLLLCACERKEFNGCRTGNESQFIMEYEVFNTTDAQELILEQGDRIQAEIMVDKGSLDIQIQKDENRPVYLKHNIRKSETFTVEIKEGGRYQITVTGHSTRGSVSFLKTAGESGNP